MIHGVYTALITPFKNEKIDYKKMEELIEFQISNKIDGLVVCGTTGEASTLSNKEQKKLIKFTVDIVNGRVPVVAGTGSNSTKHSLELSQYAEKVGVDCLLLVTPYYNKTSQQGLIEHYKAISQNVSIPCLLYNVPSRTSINIDPDTIYELSQIENIIGIKEASNNFSNIIEIISKVPGDFCVISGNDDTTIPLMSIGGKGVISVLSNIFPQQVKQMCEPFFLGDVEYAKSIQIKFAPFIKLLFLEINPMPIKEAMNILGFNVGKCRLPLINVSEKTHELLKSALINMNLLNNN